MTKVSTQRLMCDLTEGAGELDAGRATPNYDKSQKRSLFNWVALKLSLFEKRENSPADLDSVLDGFQARRLRLPLLVTEIIWARTRRHNEKIKGEAFPVFEHDEFFSNINRRDLPKQNGRILLPFEGGSEGDRDVRGREASGRYLVEKRLKEMEVSAVDQRYVRFDMTQSFRHGQPAESTSYNHDLRSHKDWCSWW
jgi:hypothetical protein